MSGEPPQAAPSPHSASTGSSSPTVVPPERRHSREHWVVLQTSVRPSVRALARSVCNGVTRAVGHRYTLRQFLTEAIEYHAARLADQYNAGQSWPTDIRPLPPGRAMTELSERPPEAD